MNDLERDRTIALAGIFQAASLAQQLARRGHADETAFNASVRSVLITDAINTMSVYGGLQGVAAGLRILAEQRGSGSKNDDFELARYVLSLAQLQNALKRQPRMMEEISQRVGQLKKELSDWDGVGFSRDVYRELADLYKDTISTLKPRVIVQGEHGHLADELVVDRVRTILLAGVRSAFLWGQLGGKRWQLVFSRRTQTRLARELLDELEEETGATRH